MYGTVDVQVRMFVICNVKKEVIGVQSCGRHPSLKESIHPIIRAIWLWTLLEGNNTLSRVSGSVAFAFSWTECIDMVIAIGRHLPLYTKVRSYRSGEVKHPSLEDSQKQA